MTKSLRIAMVGQKGIPARFGGVETHVDNVATRLAARGHEVWTYCRSRFRPDRLGVPQPDDYRVIGGEHWYRGVRLAYRPSVNTKHLDAATHTFLCALESGALHKFDVVHFHGIGPAAFAPVTRLFGKKVVSTFHALDWRQVKWGPSASRLLKRGEARGARRSHGIITVSKIMQDYVRDRYGVEAEYIPNGATLPTEAPRTGEIGRWGLSGGDYVLAVGRIIRDRGLHYLIDAFRGVPGDLKLVIVGAESPLTRYTDELREIADGRVVFTGEIFGQELEDLYANCAVYVLASRVEGLPITVCEAMSHGRPLLLSEIPENQEVAGDAALYFNPIDSNELHEKLQALLVDRTLQERLSTRGLARARSTFNWDRVTDQVEAFYHRLLGGRKRRG
jgi:glycosyltransferase involved in cell wall biosynthesis